MYTDAFLFKSNNDRFDGSGASHGVVQSGLVAMTLESSLQSTGHLNMLTLYHIGLNKVSE
jgi:hypothetical protein